MVWSIIMIMIRAMIIWLDNLEGEVPRSGWSWPLTTFLYPRVAEEVVVCQLPLELHEIASQAWKSLSGRFLKPGTKMMDFQLESTFQFEKGGRWPLLCGHWHTRKLVIHSALRQMTEQETGGPWWSRSLWFWNSIHSEDVFDQMTCFSDWLNVRH